MNLQEIQQLLALFSDGVAQLARIAEALEEQNRFNTECFAYQKEQNQERAANERTSLKISQATFDAYMEDIQERKENTANQLAQAIDTNQALLQFLTAREAKMMHTIDTLCERTAVEKPEWYEGQSHVDAAYERIRADAD